MNLDKLFKPKTIAVIGASDEKGSVGHSLMDNLINSNYDGIVYPVNIKRESVHSIRAYDSVKDIPDQIDLAIIATPAKTVPSIVENCGQAGVAGIVIISAGFSEGWAGRLWSGIGAASIASGFIWGVVSDRISRRYALALIYTLQAASFLLYGLGLITRRFEAGYYLSAVLFALTAWSIPAVMSAAAGDLMGPRLASAAFGIITLFFGVGQIFGPFVAGRLADSTGGYGAAFVLAAGVAALGAVLSAAFIPSSLSGAHSAETGS